MLLELLFESLCIAIYDGNGIEEGCFCVVQQGKSIVFEESCCDMSWEMHSVGDGLQSLRTVIDCVHGCNVGQEGLSSADIGCSFLSSNMLLSGLQRHSVGKFVVSIDRSSNDSSRHFPHILLSGWEKSRVRTAESHRHTKSLCRSEANISSHISWCLSQCQSQQIRCNNLHDLRLRLVNLVEELREIMQNTFGIRSLYDDTEKFCWVVFFEEFWVFPDDNFKIQKLCFGLNDCLRWHKYVFVKEDLLSGSFMNVVTHIESLSSSASFV